MNSEKWLKTAVAELKQRERRWGAASPTDKPKRGGENMKTTKKPLALSTAEELAERGLCRVQFFMDANLGNEVMDHALGMGMSRTSYLIQLIQADLLRKRTALSPRGTSVPIVR